MRRRLITLGAVLFAVLAGLRYAKEIFDWLPAIDFVIVHKDDTNWFGDVMRFILSPPEYLYNPPGFVVLFVLCAGLLIIYLDNLRFRRNAVASSIIYEQETSGEVDRHHQMARWLENKLSDNLLQIDNIRLFGSVVHDHYNTSDVDVIVMFKIIPDTKIGDLVRVLKEKVASEFSETFSHNLHMTFFCAHEQNAMDDFLDRAGKYETLRMKR